MFHSLLHTSMAAYGHAPFNPLHLPKHGPDLSQKDLQGLWAYVFKGQNPKLEVFTTKVASLQRLKLSRALVFQSACQCMETPGGGLIITSITPLSEQTDKRRVRAASEFARCARSVLIDRTR